MLKVKDLIERLNGMVDRDPAALELEVYVRAFAEGGRYHCSVDDDSVFVENLNLPNGSFYEKRDVFLMEVSQDE